MGTFAFYLSIMCLHAIFYCRAVGVPLLPVNRFRFIRLEDGDDMGEDKLPKLKLLTRVKVLINLIFSDNDKTSPPTSGPTPPPPPPALLVTDLLQMVDILLRVI